MEIQAAVTVKELKKRYKKFALEIPELRIPKGFATALIGENGAGKSTLLRILGGVRLDYQGGIEYFDGAMTDEEIRENTGYVGPNNYFMSRWTVDNVGKAGELLFDHFHRDRYQQLCRRLGVDMGKKSIAKLSDGTKMKTMLAAAFARDTRLLLLDEPASPLDPLMRDMLCAMLRDYLDEGDGERTVFFSTHNVADMENVTDYAIILEQGRIVEEGFVEELKEKYALVKGERVEEKQAEKLLIGCRRNAYGYEGLCLQSELEQLRGLDIAVETPTLSQICVAVMKQNTVLQMEEDVSA